MYRYSICDPLESAPFEGEIDKSRILDLVDKFPWNDLLGRMKSSGEADIHFSPSLEIENLTNRHGLSISIVEKDGGNEFYIFFKRPRLVAKLFGLIKTRDENFISDRGGQTGKDVREAVTALIDDDLATLEKRWG